MRYDFTPLHRSTVGFDRLFNLLDRGVGADVAPTYPPYNIERTSETAYRVTLAVAGFTSDELSIETRENTLTVRGGKPAAENDNAPNRPEVLYQGIAARSFERHFQLADHVVVTGAKLENGLLHVDLMREVPEAKKPRAIPINVATTAKTIEASQAA